MNVDVERLLRDDAERIGAQLGAPTVLAPDSFVPVRALRPRWRAVTWLPGAAVLAGMVVGLVWLAWPSPTSVVREVPPASSGSTDPAVSSVSTSAPDASTITSLSVTSLPSAVPTVGTPTSGQGIGVALSSTDGAAGPVGIDPLPDGYVLTRTQPPEENLMGDPTVRGWHLTAIRVPQLGQRSTPDYVMVGLDEIVDGDPFLGYPGLADAPDVTIGAFTGKELSIPGYPLFRAVVNDRVLSVGGRASMSDIEAVVEHVRVDGATNSVSVDSFPAGYEVISDGASTYAQGTRAWVVAYGKDHLTANAIAVRAIENPATSALQDLVGPTIAQIVEINGYRGVLSGFGLSLEVSPTFKIEIRREGMLAPDDPGAVSDDLLLEMARNLVAVSVEQFDEWTTATRAAPYTITDGPCTLHVDVQTDLDPTTDDAIDPQTTFTVTVSADQPLADITIGVEGGIPDQPGIGMRLVLASIAELTEPTTVTIAWDGMLDGKPVAPGVYPISLSAEPTTSDPTACANNGTLNFASYAVNE